jgi:hypothetical protein
LGKDISRRIFKYVKIPEVTIGTIKPIQFNLVKLSKKRPKVKERTKIKKLEINKKINEVKKSAILFLDKNNEKMSDVKVAIPIIVTNPRSFPLSI